MGRGSQLDLSAWSDDQLCAAEDAIEGTLLLVFKAGTVKPTAATEAKLAKEMSEAWKVAANKALGAPLRSLLSSKVTSTRINNFIKKMGAILKKPLTERQVGILKSRLTSIWKTAKAIASKEAKIAFSFTAVDAGAVAVLNTQQVFWVGNVYNEHLSARVSAVANDVLIEQGLSQVEAGKMLKEALRREMGLIPGGRSAFARSVPSRYAGNLDLYFRQVAANAAHQARSFSKLVAFQDAEIIEYELINPNDERTGSICREMHGQRFTVRSGVKQMNRMLAAKKPEDIKAAAPWLSSAELEEAIDGAQRGSRTATENLVAAGASVLPPFHPLCRTEPVIVG